MHVEEIYDYRTVITGNTAIPAASAVPQLWGFARPLRGNEGTQQQGSERSNAVAPAGTTATVTPTDMSNSMVGVARLKPEGFRAVELLK